MSDRTRIVVLTALVMVAPLPATGCASGCMPISLAAAPALHGNWIVVRASNGGGKPLAGVHLGIVLVGRPGGRSLFEDTVVTGTSGVARLDPVLDGMGPYRNSAHYYEVVPAGNTLGRSDDGYCSSASASAPFRYVGPP